MPVACSSYFKKEKKTYSKNHYNNNNYIHFLISVPVYYQKTTSYQEIAIQLQKLSGVALEWLGTLLQQGSFPSSLYCLLLSFISGLACSFSPKEGNSNPCLDSVRIPYSLVMTVLSCYTAWGSYFPITSSQVMPLCVDYVFGNESKFQTRHMWPLY